MAKKKEYASATSFRVALEDRMRVIATKEGADLGRLRRQVAYDRLLARFFIGTPALWVLKGGYAMQLRLPSARGTKDIDLAMRDNMLFSGDSGKQNEALKEILLKKAAMPMSDFFGFDITGPIMDLEGAPDGGARFHVEARLADRSFEKFHLDIGVGDIWMEPMDTLVSRAWLDFVGIPAQSFLAIPKEQQFAEKLHAYTRPRESINSRVKDLIDMILLIEIGALDKARLASITRATFERYGTHVVSKELPSPPDRWLSSYPAPAKECGITLDIAAAYKMLQDFVSTLRI